MYHPYLRGKQYELITLRENATLLAESSFTPIIEPVRRSLGPLQKTLTALIDSQVCFVLVANPQCGDFANGSLDELTKLINETLSAAPYPGASVGFWLSTEAGIQTTVRRARLLPYPVSFIHNGAARGREVAREIGNDMDLKAHIFIDGGCSRMYRRCFAHADKVLLRDGFISRKNADYPPTEHFSELHATFRDEGGTGFGDYLIVGHDYREQGGPAYAVALHLTYLDEDDDMRVHHFISDRTTSPRDPGGKFLEALAKLVRRAEEPTTLFRSNAVEEFIELHRRNHYPGLGYAKKLSMQHHIELMAHFLRRDST